MSLSVSKMASADRVSRQSYPQPRFSLSVSKMPSADGHHSRTAISSHWTERSTMARSASEASPSRGTSAQSLYINPFGFGSKTSYDATETLLQCRSDGFQLKEIIPDDDIWKKPPPDFRPQCYAPKPPKRNSQDSMKPWVYGTVPGQKEVFKRPKRTVLPHLLLPPQSDKRRFVTEGFDIPDSYESKLIYAREGMNKPESYVSPKLHDFRGYPPLKSLGLDEFETNYEHDPYNLNFKSQRLDIIHGLAQHRATDRETSGQQMAPPLPNPPHWEARLILPQSPWPKLSGEYTRYPRIGRSPHSALMERIEGQLTAEWAKAKMEEAVQEQGCN